MDGSTATVLALRRNVGFHKEEYFNVLLILVAPVCFVETKAKTIQFVFRAILSEAAHNRHLKYVGGKEEKKNLFTHSITDFFFFFFGDLTNFEPQNSHLRKKIKQKLKPKPQKTETH